MTDGRPPHLLAEGELNWSRGERQSDRYGAVLIQTGGFFARTQEELAAELPAEYARFENAPIGALGRLLVEVTATRESNHVGDLEREIKPTTPEVGEQITLGEGELFVEIDERENVASIGVRPADGRETDWMDVQSLYRAHSQDVRLYFVPDQA